MCWKYMALQSITHLNELISIYPFETGKWYSSFIPAGQARHQEVCSFLYF